MPSVLVTGAGRGIGRAVAMRPAGKGWEVHAGVRRPEDGAALASEARTARLMAVILDVRDGGRISALPETLGGRLDAVVNNAGIVVAGPIEALTIARVREQVEVNVVGQVAVTQAVLPLLRPARGRIVFLSSVSGRVATPFMGAYNASKSAIEGSPTRFGWSCGRGGSASC